MIEARALTYAYAGGVQALAGLSLAVPRGRKLAILGPNGAGKTTLLLHLNGSLKPASGQVLLEGRPADYGRAGLAAWRRRVQLVLQDPDDQLFAADILTDVAFGLRNLGLTPAEAEARARAVLESLRISELADRPPHMLSFGQKKRAALAGALAMQPDLLLLDEPTAGLDEHGARHLLHHLDRLVADGMTLAFTTHDAELALAFADEVALFEGGQVLRQGPAVEVLSDPEALRAARLKVPLVLEAGLRLRARGLLPEDGPLPRDRDQLLGLLDGLTGPAG